jgi:serine/threonine-protein kinase HipA
MKENTRKILVYADWDTLTEPQWVGELSAVFLRGKEIFSFEYAESWLNSPFAQAIDPDLELYSGLQYLHEGKSNFGIFLDSSPDRWGRVLMERKEAILSRMENRPIRHLNESDFLLGVFDEHRMGALRLKETASGAFLNNNKDFATPPWTSIRELEYASYQVENELLENDSELLKWLYLLLAPGSSLGGARPKAGVADKDGALWIAKFPSKNDRYDVGAWEMVVNELARAAGLNVAQAMSKRFSGKYHTFLSKRFDRTPSGKRLHFASAMTLLGYTDGTDFQDGVGYLDLVKFIIQKGANVNQDLEELFKRIVFSICVSNTDDHLRNHGFLLSNEGWILSPAYDINPNPQGSGLKLNISEYDNSLSLNLAMEVAPYFRLSKEVAGKIIEQIKNIVSNWSQVANRYAIARDERERMSSAFRIKDFISFPL